MAKVTLFPTFFFFIFFSSLECYVNGSIRNGNEMQPNPGLAVGPAEPLEVPSPVSCVHSAAMGWKFLNKISCVSETPLSEPAVSSEQLHNLQGILAELIFKDHAQIVKPSSEISYYPGPQDVKVTIHHSGNKADIYIVTTTASLFLAARRILAHNLDLFSATSSSNTVNGYFDAVSALMEHLTQGKVSLSTTSEYMHKKNPLSITVYKNGLDAKTCEVFSEWKHTTKLQSFCTSELCVCTFILPKEEQSNVATLEEDAESMGKLLSDKEEDIVLLSKYLSAQYKDKVGKAHLQCHVHEVPAEKSLSIECPEAQAIPNENDWKKIKQDLSLKFQRISLQYFEETSVFPIKYVTTNPKLAIKIGPLAETDFVFFTYYLQGIEARSVFGELASLVMPFYKGYDGVDFSFDHSFIVSLDLKESMWEDIHRECNRVAIFYPNKEVYTSADNCFPSCMIYFNDKESKYFGLSLLNGRPGDYCINCKAYLGDSGADALASALKSSRRCSLEKGKNVLQADDDEKAFLRALSQVETA